MFSKNQNNTLLQTRLATSPEENLPTCWINNGQKTTQQFGFTSQFSLSRFDIAMIRIP